MGVRMIAHSSEELLIPPKAVLLYHSGTQNSCSKFHEPSELGETRGSVYGFAVRAVKLKWFLFWIGQRVLKKMQIASRKVYQTKCLKARFRTGILIDLQFDNQCY